MHSAHHVKGRKGDSRQRERHVQRHHLGVKEYCLVNDVGGIGGLESEVDDNGDEIGQRIFPAHLSLSLIHADPATLSLRRKPPNTPCIFPISSNS